MLQHKGESMRFGYMPFFEGGSCRSYVLYDLFSRHAILIDPILSAVDTYVQKLNQARLSLSHVIDTHTHADHISGSALLKARTGCEYLMHRSSKVSGLTSHLDEGVSTVGEIPLGVLHTPGHTKDSLCILFPGVVFAGDLLFLDEGGAGRLDLPGGDAGEHWDSLQRILRLPDHLLIHPAHNYRNVSPSTIAEQKMCNQFLAPRTKDEYLAFAKSLHYGPAEWMKEVVTLNEACCTDAPRIYPLPEGNVCESVCEAMNADIHPAVPLTSAQLLRTRFNTHTSPALLDVREQEELVSEFPALSGSIHIPVGQIERRMGELEPYKQKPLVVICRSGARAQKAARALLDAGFADVSVLEGGMTAWAKTA